MGLWVGMHWLQVVLTLPVSQTTVSLALNSYFHENSLFQRSSWNLYFVFLSILDIMIPIIQY
jgi:hypothetical protein